MLKLNRNIFKSRPFFSVCTHLYFGHVLEFTDAVELQEEGVDHHPGSWTKQKFSFKYEFTKFLQKQCNAFSQQQSINWHFLHTPGRNH